MSLPGCSVEDRRPNSACVSGNFRVSLFRYLFGLLPLEATPETTMALTKRQKEILDYISDYIEQNGYAPSFEEIAKSFGYT